jgi:hypothetical protein
MQGKLSYLIILVNCDLTVNQLKPYYFMSQGLLDTRMRNFVIRFLLRLGCWLHIEIDIEKTSGDNNEPTDTSMG